MNSLRSYYHGFFIHDPKGNNQFSYALRKNKAIFVPALIEGTLDDLSLGEKIVFSEIHDGEELNKSGLEHFVHFQHHNKEVFIFDNHNHAFFFWLYGLKVGCFSQGIKFVHVDQHKDMREPGCYLNLDINTIDLKRAFDYTNYELNVGNFIKPALALGIFSDVEMIHSRDDFDKNFSGDFVMDLDLDIFAPEMDYIDHELKISKIKEYIRGASFITIATSPYFMDQNQAIKILQELFS